MRIKEAIKLEKEHFEKRMKIREAKGHDYAKIDADILANFKVIADVEKALEKHGYGIPTTSYGIALRHQIHKIIRQLNLWNKGVEPKNESLMDTYLDESNYLDLKKECYIDSKRDINKENNVPINLLTLCRSCNSKENRRN